RAAYRAEYRKPGRGYHEFGRDFHYGGDHRRCDIRDLVQGYRDQLMEECVIDIKGLWSQFGDHVVHRDIDLCVRKGEIMSLVGGSGSGKTTMLRQMLGLEKPARGEVRVFGISLHDGDAATARSLRDRWGMLFQEGALFSALTVYDNVALPLRELRTL